MSAFWTPGRYTCPRRTCQTSRTCRTRQTLPFWTACEHILDTRPLYLSDKMDLSDLSDKTDDLAILDTPAPHSGPRPPTFWTTLLWGLWGLWIPNHFGPGLPTFWTASEHILDTPCPIPILILRIIPMLCFAGSQPNGHHGLLWTLWTAGPDNCHMFCFPAHRPHKTHRTHRTHSLPAHGRYGLHGQPSVSLCGKKTCFHRFLIYSDY